MDLCLPHPPLYLARSSASRRPWIGQTYITQSITGNDSLDQSHVAVRVSGGRRLHFIGIVSTDNTYNQSYQKSVTHMHSRSAEAFLTLIPVIQVVTALR